jgi:hypothetical protein
MGNRVMRVQDVQPVQRSDFHDRARERQVIGRIAKQRVGRDLDFVVAQVAAEGLKAKRDGIAWARSPTTPS